MSPPLPPPGTEPAPPYNNQKQWVNPTNTGVPQVDGIKCTIAYRTTAASLNNTECGFFYNWCAALGDASYACNTSTASTSVQGAGGGLCPAGWRLPTGGSGGELQPSRLQGTVPLAGDFYPGYGLYNSSYYSFHWSSTAASSTTAYLLTTDQGGGFSTGANQKFYGFNVRCIAERPIQNYTKSTCPTTLTVVPDNRDGHYYAIQKLADGNCWMLTNLSYAVGTELTSGAGQSTTTGVAASATNWNQASPPYNYQSQRVNPANTNVTLYGGTRCAAAYRTTAASINYTECGYLYNWCAAITGPFTPTECGKSTAGDINGAGQNICPTGWRLPRSGEYQAMYTAIGGTPANLIGTTSTWRGASAGAFYPGSGLMNNSPNGAYWTAKNSDFTTAAYLYTSSSSVIPDYTSSGGKYIGRAIRCLAN